MDFVTFLGRQGVNKYSSEKRVKQILSTLTFASHFKSYLNQKGTTKADIKKALLFLEERGVLGSIAQHGLSFQDIVNDAATKKKIDLTVDSDSEEGKPDGNDPNEGSSGTTGNQGPNPTSGGKKDSESGGPNPSPNVDDPSTGQPDSGTSSGIPWKTSYQEAFSDFSHQEGNINEAYFRRKHFGQNLTEGQWSNLKSQFFTELENSRTPINPNYVDFPTGQELERAIREHLTPTAFGPRTLTEDIRQRAGNLQHQAM